MTRHLTLGHVKAALKLTCEVCEAPPGEWCHNTVTESGPIKGWVHFGRKEIRP